MVEPDHPRLTVQQQCELLGLARSSLYYQPVGETSYNLELMRTIAQIIHDPNLHPPLGM